MSVPSISVVDSTGTPRTVGALPEQVAGRTPVETLGAPGVARQIAVSPSSGGTAVTLTSTCTRISIVAVGVRMRFAVGETPTASSTTSNFINADERLDFAVPAGSKIAAVTYNTDSGTGTLELTELAHPA